MLSRVFVSCLILSLCAAAASSLSCRWMDHKFKDYNTNAIKLLNQMAYNSTNMTDTLVDMDIVSMHQILYVQSAKASVEERLRFIVHMVEEVTTLFKGDTSGASWEPQKQDDFLNIINQQASGLRTCLTTTRKSKKLQLFFKKLSDFIQKNGHTAMSWELVRREIKVLLSVVASPIGTI
ncbi:interferon a3-like [Synchiropus splendidus]|uniref:interferon a3-like n=1 Tax=Synchiropus splendidus TaxID=270530 RepID=UPI00237D92B2|nr:interferon a3-like [Synchiropus splendidus]